MGFVLFQKQCVLWFWVTWSTLFSCLFLQHWHQPADHWADAPLLPKVIRVLPDCTASMRLSQSLALPGIPQLPVEVANYQISTLHPYRPEKKKQICNRSALNFHTVLLASVPATRRTRRHFQLSVKFRTMGLQGDQTQHASAIVRFIWTGSARTVDI